MKTTIRMNSFETNSSSTHALVMCTGDEYHKWKAGELYYSSDAGRFMTFDETAKYYENNVTYDGSSWVPNNDDNWVDCDVARSLNKECAADAYYGTIYAWYHLRRRRR